MRLSNLRALLDDPVFVKNPVAEVATANHNLRRIQGVQVIQNWMARLKEVPTFRQYLDQLTSGFPFLGQYTEPEVTLHSEQSQNFVKATNALYAHITHVREFLHSIASIGRGDAFAIKLPEATDFRSAIDDQGALLKALEQVLLEDPINARIQLVTGEPGSIWLHIGLGSVIAVNVIGSITWAAAVVRKKWYEGDIIREQAAKLEVERNLLDALAAATADAARKTLELEARKIRADYYGKKEDPEALERMKNTIKIFAELINRGAEIAPSLIVPEQAANVFPNFGQLNTIVSKVEQLTEHSPQQTSEKVA